MTVQIPTGDEADAGYSVLIEVITVLGLYVDGMVVIGGWVPELRFPKKGHTGSLDVDLALDSRRIKPDAYASIRTRLLQEGYKQTDLYSGIFVKDVPGKAASISVKLDMVTGLADGADGEPNTLIQDLRIGQLRGVEVALDHASTVELTGKLPTGETNTVKPRVVDIPAFLCMKAIALNERKKEKDAYDIYFCLLHCDGGPGALADQCRYLQTLNQGRQAIALLAEKFASVDSVGPQWAASVAVELGEDRDNAARDAFERAQAFLARLRLPDNP